MKLALAVMLLPKVNIKSIHNERHVSLHHLLIAFLKIFKLQGNGNQSYEITSFISAVCYYAAAFANYSFNITIGWNLRVQRVLT